MSQYIVKASFCFAGLALKLQSAFFRQFSDTNSGQTAATVDLSGTKLQTSQKCHKLEFVGCSDMSCPACSVESF